MFHSIGSLGGAACSAVFLIVTTVQLSACSRSSDEQQLRDALATMQQAIEDRKPSNFMEHVADDFTAPDADMDRRKVHDMLRLQVLRNERIGITTVVRDLHVEGDRATITLTSTLTGSSGGWLPERGSVYTVTTGWRKDEGDWKLVQASWERSL
ncbi:MAG: nuclear transport factor 2 family protein [Dokdonella sp.]